MPYKDKEKQLAYQREWIARQRREWIDANGPCVLCGSHQRLEVDHIDPSVKVTHNIWSWSRERRKKELVKCRVLCYECHKTKSATEQLKGEDKTQSKLTEQDVMSIREEYQPRVRGCGYGALAKKYNVSKTTIQRILIRLKWKHI
jgi:hypothetical protein